jgi:hypothetical protein
VQAVLKRHCLTLDEFLDEVRARTSDRWCYFSGLTMLKGIEGLD